MSKYIPFVPKRHVVGPAWPFDLSAMCWGLGASTGSAEGLGVKGLGFRVLGFRSLGVYGLGV